MRNLTPQERRLQLVAQACALATGLILLPVTVALGSPPLLIADLVLIIAAAVMLIFSARVVVRSRREGRRQPSAH